MKYLLFVFLLTASFATPSLHEYYVSNCYIEHNPSEKTLEIALNIFTDDLEAALEQEMNIADLFLDQKKENKAVDEFIFKYIQAHTSLKVNDNPVELQYLGREMALDGAWCYLTASDIPKMDSISIESSFLYETFPTQTNIFHCTANSIEKSVWLRHSDSKKMIVFDDK
ncbi:MAG: DUF6702 family protein [Chitinophagales bacterium]